MLLGGRGPQVNKFKQVSSVGLQMSLSEAKSLLWCWGVGPRSDVHGVYPTWPFPEKGTLTCDLSPEAFGVTYPLPVNKQTPVKEFYFSTSFVGGK